MKIKKMNIENFGPIEKMEFIPEKKIVALIGPNGVGKSRFLDAVRFGVTGTADNKNIIRKGCDLTNVQIEFEDNNIYQRSKKITKDCILSKSKLNGKSASEKVITETFERDYGVSVGDSKNVISVKNFTQMTPGELTDMIMKYVPEELTAEQIVSYLENPDEDTIKMLSDNLPANCKFGTDKIKEEYEYFFEKRKSLKKEVEKLFVLTEKEVDEPFLTKEEIAEEIADIALKEKEAKEYDKKNKEYITAIESKKKHDAELKKAEEDLKKLTVSKPDTKKKEEWEEKRKETREAGMKAKTTIATLQNNGTLFEKLLNNLENTVCPISQKLICTTDKSQIKDDTQKQLEEIRKNISIQKDIYTSSEKVFEEMNKNLENYQKQEKDFILKTSIEDKIKTLKESTIIVPEKPDKIDIQDISARKKSIEKEKENQSNYDTYLKNLTELREKKRELNACENITQALAPKGVVMMKIVDYYISTFEEVIENRSNELGLGYEVQLRNQNGLNIYCNPNKDTLVHFEDLSTGEKICVEFLVLDMLNNLTGTKIMILDEIQDLDKDALETLIDLLCKAADDYDHIFIAGVDYSEVVEILSKHKNDIQIIQKRRA